MVSLPIPYWLGILSGLFPPISRSILGHVEYVGPKIKESTDPVQFLVSVLSDPVALGIVVMGGSLPVIGFAGYLYVYESAPIDIYVLRETLTEDAQFLPWLLRLSMGLPLIGAGFAGYFISPAVNVPDEFLLSLLSRLYLTGLGFLLLYGIMTRVVAAVGLLTFLGTVSIAPELLLASEYLGGLLAIVVLGGDRPSVDQLLDRLAERDGTFYGRLSLVQFVRRRTKQLDQRLDPYTVYTPTILRVGLGFNFIYTGLADKLLQPAAALAVVEQYHLTRVVPVKPGLWVVGAGGAEVLLGCALVIGLFTRGVAAMAFGLFTVTLFALPDDPVLAHISLFGIATALLITGSGRIALDNI